MYTDDLFYRYPRLPYVINLFLSIAVLVVLLIFARDILSGISKKGEKVSAPPAPRAAVEEGLQEYTGVLKNNPFGFAGGQLKELSVAKEGSVSQSDITLIGTVSGSARNSYAIFVDKSGKQELVKVGEPVFGAGKLKRVDSDRVTSRAGQGNKDPHGRDTHHKGGKSDRGWQRDIRPCAKYGEKDVPCGSKEDPPCPENPNQLMTDARLQSEFVNGKQEG